MIALALLALIGADTIALKEKANVSGRWIRALDLVDAERSDSAARLRLADIYLGRAPEDGKTRTITLDEIRRELERRGVDPSAFTWLGNRVDVAAGLSAASEPLRSAIASALQHQLPAEAAVRIVQLQPETCPEGVMSRRSATDRRSTWS